MSERSARGSWRKRLRNTGCLIALVIVLVLLGLVVLLAVIAKDPSGAAGGVNHWWGALGDGARSVLSAPIDFFRSLLRFGEEIGG
ncbi:MULTISPECIES: hypothetical protein [Saccharopolyspora]|uniref:Uncharacterized protein n=1 Tax=Saccharopolyspora gregorii TaxID=33914 RepID=A0ABP6RQG2_9PSEU|nr:MULTISPECIES: hypothetical protein [unclassified Saccharopolyspora]MCA1190585.1 hypothetical protein [Saccharopolyspora sp. 6V]MCA1226455.1 hypothetical protein [Saccharopolyspora sp. 6M]MCA1283598.1 hypothetical protein [Saccharopolyspora sp. 7B]